MQHCVYPANHAISCWFWCRYEDGDAEHLLWSDLKKILIALPGQDGDTDLTTPAVNTNANKRAAATEGIA